MKRITRRCWTRRASAAGSSLPPSRHLGARFLELLHISPLYKWVYETASKELLRLDREAQRQLGYKPRYSNKDALLRNFRWYIEHEADFANQSGVSHRVPWKQVPSASSSAHF
ncbi:MAG: hypothetical protein U0232_11610 [Thermomicrobiales bacterium]